MKLNNESRFGASFSIKQCRGFGVDPKETLKFLINEMGIKRFRLMSYWDEIEKNKGKYDFSELGWQIEMIKKNGGSVSLCLGLRQPRWPESHYPEWAKELSSEDLIKEILKFNKKVIERYRNEACIKSWQLENEALNRGFGVDGNFDRKRLRQEMEQLRSLSSDKTIIMSTSNTWGLPIRRPRPDVFGFTLYKIQYKNGQYKTSHLPATWYRLRALIIRLVTFKKSFIHELQLEPWGPGSTQDMSLGEQGKSMGVSQVRSNLTLAKRTRLYPIDMWGAEWWYWRKVHGDETIWKAVYGEIRK
jgi:hypothetical protein